MSSPFWRKAAAVIICARTQDHYRICFVARSAKSRVFPGSYVFPGGTLEDSDVEMAKALGGNDTDATALRICAIREVLEETGILLTDPPKVVNGPNRRKLEIDDLRNSVNSLYPIAVWKTPVELAMHAKGGFETNFFLTLPQDLKILLLRC